MISEEELKQARETAYENYQQKFLDLQKVEDTALTAAAQAANDAWVEFKKVDNMLSNFSVYQKLGDLYGC